MLSFMTSFMTWRILPISALIWVVNLGIWLIDPTYTVLSNEVGAHCQRRHNQDGASNANQYCRADHLQRWRVEKCYCPQPCAATQREQNTQYHGRLDKKKHGSRCQARTATKLRTRQHLSSQLGS